MKGKWVAFCVTLLLALSLGMGALAAPGDAVLFPAPTDGTYNGNARTMAAVEDTLYMLGNNGLYTWKVGDQEPRLVSDQVRMGYVSNEWDTLSKEEQAELENSTNLLLARGGQLYGLNTVKGSLLSLTVSEKEITYQEVYTLDWSNMYVQESGYVYSRHIYGAVLTDSYLYMLVQPEGDRWNTRDLLCFDLAAGTQAKLEIKNVQAIAPYQGNQLLCNIFDWENMYTADGKMVPPAVSVLDSATQVLTKLADFPGDRMGGIGYDEKSGTVYGIGKGELYAYKAGGAFESVAYVPVDHPNESTVPAILSGGLYAVIMDDGSVLVRNTDPALKSNKVLRIAGGYSDTITQSFRNDHPDIPVLFVEEWYRNAEEIAKEMVSGSESADLFLVSLSYGGFTSLRDKGYAQDLSGSAILTDAVAKMYPQYVADLFKDGKLIAFPQRFDCYTLGYAPALLEELGIEQPPKTFSELMDLYVDWVEEYAQAYPGYTIQEYIYDVRSELLNHVLMGYLAHYARNGEDLKFDTPLFRALLQKLDEVSPIIKELNPSDSGSSTRVYYSSGFDNAPTSLLSNGSFYPQEYSSVESNNYLLLPLALEEGIEPALFAQITVFVLNPNSKNQDIAMEYLEYFAKNMPGHLAITFCPEENTPVEEPGYVKEIEAAKKNLDDLLEQQKTAPPEMQKNLETWIADQKEYLSWREKNRFIVSPEMIERYRAMVPYICVDTQNIDLLTRSSEALTLFQRFIDGEMRSEQFIKEFDRKLQMIRLENN